MAISIKNHEDRITALENKAGNQSEQFFIACCSRSASILSCGILIPSKAHKRLILHTYGESPSYRGKYESTNMTENVTLSNGECTLNYVSDNGVYKTYSLSVSGDWGNNHLLIAYWLKLYYNFSYNITREFYKVKFKLRHYLCSHLQNYASNKGGVIQNGY